MTIRPQKNTEQHRQDRHRFSLSVFFCVFLWPECSLRWPRSDRRGSGRAPRSSRWTSSSATEPRGDRQGPEGGGFRDPGRRAAAGDLDVHLSGDRRQAGGRDHRRPPRRRRSEGAGGCASDGAGDDRRGDAGRAGAVDVAGAGRPAADRAAVRRQLDAARGVQRSVDSARKPSPSR